MIESLYITKSKIRRDLLALLYADPSKRYYLRQLHRLLGYSAGSIRRELLRFQQDGLFHVEKAGNLVYYALDTHHPLFAEMKSIVSKTVGAENRLRKTLSAVSGIDMAFIYGSYAAKREKSSSDIDVMIVGEPDISKLNKAIRKLEGELGREISPVIYEGAEYETRKRDRGGFIREVLANPKIMLVGSDDDL